MFERIEGDQRTNCDRASPIADLGAVKSIHGAVVIGLNFAQAARLVERNNPAVHLRDDLRNRKLEDTRRSRILECRDQRIDLALGDDRLNRKRLPAGKR